MTKRALALVATRAAALVGQPASAAVARQAVVVAGPASSTAGYVTPITTAPTGAAAVFHNLDTVAHDVVASDWDELGHPIFSSGFVASGTSGPIEGVELLPPGDYRYFCSIHPAMRGTLQVVELRSGTGATSGN